MSEWLSPAQGWKGVQLVVHFWPIADSGWKPCYSDYSVAYMKWADGHQNHHTVVFDICQICFQALFCFGLHLLVSVSPEKQKKETAGMAMKM